MAKLKVNILNRLALMICGDSPYGDFPYRSSSRLSDFFWEIDLDYTHDGSTRKRWVISVLEELNEKPSLEPEFPSQELRRVIEYLLDPGFFENHNHEHAIAQVNRILKSQNLCVEKDEDTGVVNLRRILGDFISTSTDVREAKKVITFTPSVFEIPDKPVVKNCVSVMMPFSMELGKVLESIKGACSNVG